MDKPATAKFYDDLPGHLDPWTNRELLKWYEREVREGRAIVLSTPWRPDDHLYEIVRGTVGEKDV